MRNSREIIEIEMSSSNKSLNNLENENVKTYNASDKKDDFINDEG